MAKKVYERNDGDDMIAQATMILHSKAGEPRSRQFMLYAREPQLGEISTLIRFKEPVDVKGVGLLTVNRPGAEDTDQWVFLPAVKKSRRISSSRKGGAFVNSDFYYEEFQDRPVARDHHKFLGKEKWEGVEAVVIESVPVSKKNSAYSKRKVWIHPQIWVPIRIDFYEGTAASPTKRMTAKKIQKVQEIWTVLESEMESMRDGTKTVIRINKIKYNSGIKSDFFSLKTLEDPSQEISAK